jgi:hypothetical protein
MLRRWPPNDKETKSPKGLTLAFDPPSAAPCLPDGFAA